MPKKISLKALLPLNEAILYVLLALLEAREAEHINMAIKEKTSRHFKLSTNQLESILKNLQAKHLVVTVAPNNNEEGRHDRYVITPLGKEVLHMELKRLTQVTTDVQNVLLNLTSKSESNKDAKH